MPDSNDNDNYDTSGKSMDPCHHSTTKDPFEHDTRDLLDCSRASHLLPYINIHLAPSVACVCINWCNAPSAAARLHRTVA